MSLDKITRRFAFLLVALSSVGGKNVDGTSKAISSLIAMSRSNSNQKTTRDSCSRPPFNLILIKISRSDLRFNDAVFDVIYVLTVKVETDNESRLRAIKR